MYKIIVSIIAILFLIKAIIEDKTEKAYDYLFISFLLFAILVLVKPI